MKKSLLFFLASIAGAQNFTVNSSFTPISRVSFLHSSLNCYGGKNVFGDPSLLLYFPMTQSASISQVNGVATLCDASGNGYTATYGGMVQGTYQGKIGSFAVHFTKNNPQSIYLVSPTPSVTASYTVMAWVEPDAPVTSSYPRIVENYYAAGFYLGGNNSGNYAGFGSGKSVSGGTISTSGLPSQWHHLAITYNAGTLTFYLDGASQGTQTSVSAPTSTQQTALGYCPAYPGGVSAGCSGASGAWDGIIQGVRIYTRALSGPEILAIYNAENH